MARVREPRPGRPPATDHRGSHRPVTTPAIETIDLTKRFRMPRALRAMAAGRFDVSERVAVDDVSLSIPQGQVFGLLGQNGAGKTTLVRMLTTLLLPTSGTARIDGIDVARDPLAVRSRVGLVNGDERSFYWRLTGRQNLEFFAALRHLDRTAATVAIDRLASSLGMTEHIDRPFRMLSSGQRQALAIARGLLDEPSIVFMDEPTRSLDPTRRCDSVASSLTSWSESSGARWSSPPTRCRRPKRCAIDWRSSRTVKSWPPALSRSCGARSAMGRAASFVSAR